MNTYLQQVSGHHSSMGGDHEDELELELISGSIDDLQDETEILGYHPPRKPKKLRRVQRNIQKQLNAMMRRSKRVRCPYRRRLIQQRIRRLKRHGSLNKQYTTLEKVAYSSVVGLGGVFLTAVGYQHYLSRDISAPQQALATQNVEFFNDNPDGGPFLARPKITHLLQQYKGFYLAEFLVLAGLYHKFILPKGDENE